MSRTRKQLDNYQRRKKGVEAPNVLYVTLEGRAVPFPAAALLSSLPVAHCGTENSLATGSSSFVS
jgi:hypothetical protein